MAVAAEPFIITVEQFRALPKREHAVRELRWGLVVDVTFPKVRRTRVQMRLIALLSPHAAGKGVIGAEIPFRAVPEYDLRAADVAFVSQQRWDAADEDDNLRGAPELVIEVLSPSNTVAEMRERAALCLANGAEEFWVVDPERRVVNVMKRDGERAVIEAGGEIQCGVLGCVVRVAEIFGKQ